MSWWKEIAIFFTGLFASKIFEDSMPKMDVRPFLRKSFHYIGASFMVMVAFFTPQPKTLSKTQVTQITALILILVLATIIKVLKEAEQNKKNNLVD